MIIEFIGLMGAGKTTLHRHSVRRLKTEGRAVWTPQMLGHLCGSGRFGLLRRLCFRARACWISRGLVALAVCHLWRGNRPWTDRLKGLRWFLTCLGNRWKARHTLAPHQVALTDEGLGQRMVNIFIHDSGPNDLEAIRRYARTQPLADVFIYLMLPPEVGLARALARSKQLPSRFKTMEPAQLSTVFSNTAQALDVLVDEIRKSAPHSANIVVIQSDDLDAAKRELDEHLDTILASARSRRDPRMADSYLARAEQLARL